MWIGGQEERDGMILRFHQRRVGGLARYLNYANPARGDQATGNVRQQTVGYVRYQGQ